MKVALCIAGLFTILAEGSTFHHKTRNELKKPDCTEECGFQLQLTLELCNIHDGTLPIPDEGEFKNCLVNHFVQDHVSK